MEIFGIALVVLILISVAATFTAVARDGRGHTPPEYSIRDWSALDLPSRNHTTRALEDGRLFLLSPTLSQLPAGHPPA